ncbi:MAG TPA: flagellar biosynthesis regulator FlaF [Alphaproteobacteria bacterium]
MSNNPYAQAAGTYGKQAKETSSQRELEGQLLLKAANEIQNLQDNWDKATPEDIDNILTYNRKLWMLFFDTAIENPDERPVDLRNNIVNLCNFIFKRSMDVLAQPSKEKLGVLIDINRQIAAGLMTKNAATAAAPKTTPAEAARQSGGLNSEA